MPVLLVLLLQIYISQAQGQTPAQVQQVVVSSTTDSTMWQLFLENKKKRGRLIALYSKSNLPEEVVALKIELHFIQNQMAKQLSTEVSTETNAAFTNSQLSVCDLKLLDKSLRDFERIYLPQAPANKFWEGVVLLQRELTHINAWLSKLEGLTDNNIGALDPLDAAEIFKALHEGAAISVFASLQRLEQFLESERVTLIFKYDETQDIVATTYSQLHTIIENIKQVERKEKSQEEVLLAIASIGNSKNKMTNYKERIDFILRVILEDIIFSDEYKAKGDVDVLAALDNINYQLATRKTQGISDLKKILELAQAQAQAIIQDQTQTIVQDEVVAESAKSNLDCEFEASSAQNSVFQRDEAMDFTSPVFEAIAIREAEVKSAGKARIVPVLKPWTSYIDPVCLQLKQWQTNHNFWCNSDSQVGCERSFASLCKSVN